MDRKLRRDEADRRATRRSLVRTADRSEKIRTYNYPQVHIRERLRTVHLPYENRVV